MRYSAATIGAEADRTASSVGDQQKFEQRAPEAPFNVAAKVSARRWCVGRRRGKLFSWLTMKE